MGLQVAGSTGEFGIGGHTSALFDFDSGNASWWADSSGDVGIVAVLGWAGQSAGSYSVNTTMDTGISRDSAGVFDFGNGTSRNKTGTINAAHANLNALASAAGTDPVCINTSTGALTYFTACTASDERLKNIGPRIDDALTKLLSINGFYFTWKDQEKYGAGRQIGVGAQTVEKVFPELVHTGSDGIKNVDYDKLAAPIIEALRELKADNDNLKACQNNWRCRLFGR